MPEKIKIFISYSHEDKTYCKELRKHLNSLKKANLVDSWEDGELLPGENWDDVIKKNLEASDIVLFLLSIDFLNSNYIDKNEIKIAVEKHHKGELTIVPVLVRTCYIEGTIFEELQGLPNPFEPIEGNTWHTKDHAYVNVVSGLSKIIKKLIEGKELERKKLEQQVLKRKEFERKELERKELERKELEHKELERKELEHKELERKELERIELELKDIAIFFRIKKACIKIVKFNISEKYNVYNIIIILLVALWVLYFFPWNVRVNNAYSNKKYIYENDSDSHHSKRPGLLIYGEHSSDRRELEIADKYFISDYYTAALPIYLKYKDQYLLNGRQMNNIGFMFECGIGINNNIIEAVKWYQASANYSNPIGQFNLARMFENAIGLSKNMDSAKVLYQKSAQLGYLGSQKACIRLGITW